MLVSCKRCVKPVASSMHRRSPPAGSMQVQQQRATIATSGAIKTAATTLLSSSRSHRQVDRQILMLHGCQLPKLLRCQQVRGAVHSMQPRRGGPARRQRHHRAESSPVLEGQPTNDFTSARGRRRCAVKRPLKAHGPGHQQRRRRKARLSGVPLTRDRRTESPH